MMKKTGFTLIELLIVVAIIGILAAIAIPNFLNAQVRAKVAHQQANMVAMTTALESYAVDYNVYPPCTETGAVISTWWKVSPVPNAGCLTSPIAYISSSAAMQDIFREAHKFTDPIANQVMYLPSNYYYPDAGAVARQTRRYGAFSLRSAGPDTWYQCCKPVTVRGDYGNGGWQQASYDPTNGTISFGDIYRSQKRPAEDHVGT